MKTKITVLILLSVFFALTLSSALRTSGTVDEIAHHIPVGYVLLTKWDFKMGTDSPPLARYIIALPLKLFMKITIPADKDQWRRADRSSFGRDFFYKYNTEPKKMLFFGRIPVIVIAVLCGLLLFIWAASLYGNSAGLLSLFLYCFSPVVIAHSGLATADAITAFFIFLAAYAFWLFLSDMTIKKMIFAGILLGLAQLCKYNAILLYPVFLLLLLFELPLVSKWEKGVIAAKFMAIIAISAIVIWCGYGFDIQPIFKDTAHVEEKIRIAHNIILKFAPHFSDFKGIDKFLSQSPVPLGTYILGIMGVFRHSYEGHAAYFMGNWFAGGNKLYFLTAFLIKNPLPMLIMFLTGIFITCKNGVSRAERIFLLIIGVFFIVSSFGRLQIGIRHLLPLYPFCFMITGRSAALLKKRYLDVVFVVLMVWQVAATFVVWPNYIGYFNELVGGPGFGYKYLRDSNLDWGQDLPALSSYMKKNDIKEITLDYFGQADPSSYGISYSEFQPNDFERPGDKLYAISVQYLESVKWTKGYKPNTIAGSSIFIYDLRKRTLDERE